jgi:hypothetical protein
MVVRRGGWAPCLGSPARLQRRCRHVLGLLDGVVGWRGGGLGGEGRMAGAEIAPAMSALFSCPREALCND